MTYYEKQTNKIMNRDFKILTKKLREIFFETPGNKDFFLDTFYNFLEIYRDVSHRNPICKIESKEYKIFLVRK